MLKNNMNRQEANLELLTILHKLVMDHPDLRFGQILENFGYYYTVDLGGQYCSSQYHIEPQEILERVQEEIQRLTLTKDDEKL